MTPFCPASDGAPIFARRGLGALTVAGATGAANYAFSGAAQIVAARANDRAIANANDANLAATLAWARDSRRRVAASTSIAQATSGINWEMIGTIGVIVGVLVEVVKYARRK